MVMKKVGYFLLLVLSGLLVRVPVSGQGVNMTLLSQWDNNALPVAANGIIYNQVVGWVDASGNEYAIVGTLNGILLFNVNNKFAPLLLTTLTDGCLDCRQRDFKVNNGYLYTVSDYNMTNSAFRVWNLNSLPGSMPTMVYNSTTRFTTAHAIEINPASGRAYIVGSDTRPNGVIIFDINTTPAAPIHLATFTFPPAGHDVFIQKDTVIYFAGNSGIGKYNLVNLAAPSNLGSITTYAEQGYAHTGAMTSDGNTLIVCDETNDKGVKIFDVTDITAPNLTTVFRSTLMAPTYTNSMAHTPYIMNDTLLFIAYYHDGLQLYNIKNKTAPVNIGYYDTHTTHTDYIGFKGCIAAYPYLPSKNILALDAQNGLFILSSTAVNFPVELSSFSAQPFSGRVALNWSTESESNNRGFRIERSSDGAAFEQIGNVEGHGTYTGHLDYTFDDNSPLDGVSYYRLRQEDLDGTFSYSDIKTVNFTGSFYTVSVSPTLLTEGAPITINFFNEEARDIQLSLYDIAGHQLRTITQGMGKGNQALTVDTQGISAGVYLLDMVAGTHAERWKVQVTE